MPLSRLVYPLDRPFSLSHAVLNHLDFLEELDHKFLLRVLLRLLRVLAVAQQPVERSAATIIILGIISYVNP